MAANCRKIHKYSTTSKTQHSIPHAAVPRMFSYTYPTGTKNFSYIQNSIPYSILYSRIPSLLRVYHHRPKAIAPIKYSLNFEIRRLWDADGDPYRAVDARRVISI